MERYSFDKPTFDVIEKSCLPFAVYQFVNKRVVTLALSKGFLDLFGFEDKAEAYWLMDNDMYMDAHPDDAGMISDEAYRFATKGGSYNVVYRTRRKNKRDEGFIVVHAQGEHIFTDDGTRLAVVWYTNEGVFTDESEGAGNSEDLTYSFSRMLRESSMVRQNNYDALTGLPKMTYFFDLAEQARKEASEKNRQLTILFFDLCGMSDFNRKYGFAEGDELLRAFSRVLVRFFGNENLSRFGQDYFTAFTDNYNIERMLRNIFGECSRMNGGKTLPVRVGIYTESGTPVEIPLACDRAKMACDKLRGAYVSTFAFFDENMVAESAMRQHVLDNFDKALSERWIKVYYQPIIRSANGKVCHEEALARWLDPVKGFLSPADFIPVLEDTKLIYKLDLYVLERMIEKMRTVHDAGMYVVPASINLSRADFDACDIVEEVRKIVDEAGMDHGLFNIEITESVIGSDFDYMKEQVERFRRLGFKVWMDDFGSGYSSLDVLQSIHFDVIKLDMRFMQQFDNTDKSKIILTELTKMASGLGISTVAEGVEELEQIEFLSEIGCNMLQGFYYCRPIPLEEILERKILGVQIGIENPKEAAYYAAISNVGLYDPASIVKDDSEDSMGRYFNTMPAAVLEVCGDTHPVLRCNRPYREFMHRRFGIDFEKLPLVLRDPNGGAGWEFVEAANLCAETGRKLMVDEEVGGVTIHSIMRRIDVNPVSGAAAIAVVVLAETTGDAK